MNWPTDSTRPRHCTHSYIFALCWTFDTLTEPVFSVPNCQNAFRESVLLSPSVSTKPQLISSLVCPMNDS